MNRHWCPESEAFTGADSLLTLQHRGWEIVDVVIDRTFRCITQQVTVYVFRLRLDTKTVTMRVIANPFVDRMVDQLGDVQQHSFRSEDRDRRMMARANARSGQ